MLPDELYYTRYFRIVNNIFKIISGKTKGRLKQVLNPISDGL